MPLPIEYYVVLLLYNISKKFSIKKCPVRTLNFPIKSSFSGYMRDLRRMRKFENVGIFIVLRRKTGKSLFTGMNNHMRQSLKNLKGKNLKVNFSLPFFMRPDFRRFSQNIVLSCQLAWWTQRYFQSLFLSDTVHRDWLNQLIFWSFH